MLKRLLKFFARRPQVDYSNIGRNDDCPCGSGRKFKLCCIDHVERKNRAHRDSSLFGSSKG